MKVEDSDDEDDEWDPDIRVFDPVESDDDSVLDALQRDWRGTWAPDQSSRTVCRPVCTVPREVPTCGATQLLRM